MVVYPEDYIDVVPASGQGDWSQAFLDMFTSLENSPSGSGNERRTGTYIQLKANYTYKFSKELEINRPHKIVGGGRGASWGSTILLFPEDSRGIVIPGWPRVSYDPNGSIGFGCQLFDLMIQSEGGNNSQAHGIYMQGHAFISNVYVRGFPGHGIRIDGHSQNGQSANSNNWFIQYTQISGCGRCGLFVSGPDSNAGTAVALNVHGNGTQAPAENPNSQNIDDRYTAGIRDASFLGNYYFGCHANEPSIRSYVSQESASGRNHFFACYEERGGPFSKMKYGMVLGGNILPDPIDRAPAYQAGRWTGLVKFQGKDNLTEVELGDDGLTGCGFNFTQKMNGSTALNLMYETTWDTFKFSHARVSPASLRFTTANSRVTPHPDAEKLLPNKVWIPEHYEGESGSVLRKGYGTVPPTNLTNWPVGSIFVNTNPGVGTASEWRLVDTGSGNLVWKISSVIQ